MRLFPLRSLAVLALAASAARAASVSFPKTSQSFNTVEGSVRHTDSCTTLGGHGAQAWCYGLRKSDFNYNITVTYAMRTGCEQTELGPFSYSAINSEHPTEVKTEGAEGKKSYDWSGAGPEGAFEHWHAYEAEGHCFVFDLKGVAGGVGEAQPDESMDQAVDKAFSRMWTTDLDKSKPAPVEAIREAPPAGSAPAAAADSGASSEPSGDGSVDLLPLPGEHRKKVSRSLDAKAKLARGVCLEAETDEVPTLHRTPGMVEDCAAFQEIDAARTKSDDPSSFDAPLRTMTTLVLQRRSESLERALGLCPARPYTQMDAQGRKPVYPPNPGRLSETASRDQACAWASKRVAFQCGVISQNQEVVSQGKASGAPSSDYYRALATLRLAAASIAEAERVRNREGCLPR